MRDYIVLKTDPMGDLTDQFTICNSLFVDYVTTSELFLALYQENGDPWVSYFIQEGRNVKDLTERITIVFNDKNNFFWKSGIAVKPHSWYHACFGLDAVSGQLRIVINGIILVDELITYFINSKDTKPKSLANHVAMFKSYVPGMWYQSHGKFTNMQVFSSQLTVQAMKSITEGECVEGKTTEGNYLAWSDMEWEYFGNIHEGTVEMDELCDTEQFSTVLFTVRFGTWVKCMHFCENMQRSRPPPVYTKEETQNIFNLGEKIIFDNKSGKRSSQSYCCPDLF